MTRKQKNTINEKRNTLEGINSRLDEAENQVSDLEDKVEENIQLERAAKRKKKKKKDSLREPWDNVKQNNMHILLVPEGEGIEKLFEKRQVSRSTESPKTR